MATVRGGTVLPHVQRFVNDVARETGADSFGTYAGHEPTIDRAVDCFVVVYSLQLGTAISNYAIANMDKYGIWYLIFRQKIYNPEVGNYWRAMEDRGSATANHFDHVHVSFYAETTNVPNVPEKGKDSMAPFMKWTYDGQDYWVERTKGGMFVTGTDGQLVALGRGEGFDDRGVVDKSVHDLFRGMYGNGGEE